MQLEKPKIPELWPINPHRKNTSAILYVTFMASEATACIRHINGWPNGENKRCHSGADVPR